MTKKSKPKFRVGSRVLEAEMRAPGPCGKRGHLMANLDMQNEQGVCAWCEEIAALKVERNNWKDISGQAQDAFEEMKAERDKLREALQEGHIEYSRNHGEPDPSPAFPVRYVLAMDAWNRICNLGTNSTPASGRLSDACPECGDAVFHKETCSRASRQPKEVLIDDPRSPDGKSLTDGDRD